MLVQPLLDLYRALDGDRRTGEDDDQAVARGLEDLAGSVPGDDLADQLVVLATERVVRLLVALPRQPFLERRGAAHVVEHDDADAGFLADGHAGSVPRSPRAVGRASADGLCLARRSGQAVEPRRGTQPLEDLPRLCKRRLVTGQLAVLEERDREPERSLKGSEALRSGGKAGRIAGHARPEALNLGIRVRRAQAGGSGVDDCQKLLGTSRLREREGRPDRSDET